MQSVVARLVEWPAGRVDGARVVTLAPIERPGPASVTGRPSLPVAFRCLPATVGQPVCAGAWRPLGRAWHAMLRLRFADGLHHIAAAEWDIADLPAARAAAHDREIALLRAAGHALRDETSATRDALCGQIEALSPLGRTLGRYAAWKQRDWETLRRWPAASTIAEGDRRAVPIAVMDLAIDAAICLEQLRLPLARRLARDALRLAERSPIRAANAADLAASVAAQIAYEEGQCEEAERLVLDRLARIRAHGQIETAIRAFDVLACVAANRQRPDLALLLLDDAAALGERRGWPRLVASAALRRIEILIAVARIAEAEAAYAQVQALADRGGDYAVNSAIRQMAALAGARLAGARTPSPRVVALFRRLHGEARDRGDLLGAAQLAIRLAESIARGGDADGAAVVLRAALEQGSTASLYQMFVEAGDTVRGVMWALLEADRGDTLAYYLNSLLSCPSYDVAFPAPLSRVGRPGKISEREAAILRLIADGLPNKAIALRLGIAPETVKSHAKNIFVKLVARTRTEAVQRAQRLGLI